MQNPLLSFCNFTSYKSCQMTWKDRSCHLTMRSWPYFQTGGGYELIARYCLSPFASEFVVVTVLFSLRLCFLASRTGCQVACNWESASEEAVVEHVTGDFMGWPLQILSLTLEFCSSHSYKTWLKVDVIKMRCFAMPGILFVFSLGFYPSHHPAGLGRISSIGVNVPPECRWWLKWLRNHN